MASDTATIPFPSRFVTYLGERFPLVSHSLLIVAFFFSNYLLTAHLGVAAPAVGWRAVGGFVTVLLIFFLLRVFDEFKDFESDRINRPERPVPRGLITLAELKRVGIVVVAVMLVINFLMGPLALGLFGACFTFACLMYKEFFVSQWLKKDIFVYALSHQGIIPLLCLYSWGVSVTQHGGTLDPVFWLQVAACVGTGLGFEMGRKMRGPHEELAQEDSYTKRFGTSQAAIICLFLLLMACIFALTLGLKLHFPIWYSALVILTAIAPIYGTVAFVRDPGPKTSKGYNLFASLTMLLLYVAVDAAVLATGQVYLNF